MYFIAFFEHKRVRREFHVKTFKKYWSCIRQKQYVYNTFQGSGCIFFEDLKIWHDTEYHNMEKQQVMLLQAFSANEQNTLLNSLTLNCF